MNNLEMVTKNLNTGSYGRTLCTDGNNIGKALSGDSYYLAAASNGNLKLGYQKNSQTDVIWYSNFVTKDDLLISASGTGPTDWTVLETTGNMPFKIWNVTKASASKGAPSGCYDYGTLIVLVATASGDRWRNTLIYLPDNNNNADSKVYVRSGISTKWLAFSGADIECVS